jgi:hypothetical protein
MSERVSLSLSIHIRDPAVEHYSEYDDDNPVEMERDCNDTKYNAVRSNTIAYQCM